MFGGARGEVSRHRRAVGIALLVAYWLITLLVDPAVAVTGPLGVVVRPSAGIPPLLGVTFGPIGVAAAVGGRLLQGLFVGGGVAYTLALALGDGVAGGAAWWLWHRAPTTDGDPGVAATAASLLVVALGSAAFASAATALLASLFGTFALAPLAAEGATDRLEATVVVGVLWLAARRLGAVGDPDAGDSDDPHHADAGDSDDPHHADADDPHHADAGDRFAAAPTATRATVGRWLGVVLVGLAWLAGATGFDAVYRDFGVLPDIVLDKYLPPAVSNVAFFVFDTWWTAPVIQCLLAAAAVGVVVRLARPAGGSTDGWSAATGGRRSDGARDGRGARTGDDGEETSRTDDDDGGATGGDQPADG